MLRKAPPTQFPAPVGKLRGSSIWDRSESHSARWHMSSTLEILLIIWGGLTALLVVLLIYRSTLSIHEEDQLFLDEAEAHMQKEQDEIHAKLDRTVLPMRVLGGASAGLILVIACMWVYQGWMATQ